LQRFTRRGLTKTLPRRVSEECEDTDIQGRNGNSGVRASRASDEFENLVVEDTGGRIFTECSEFKMPLWIPLFFPVGAKYIHVTKVLLWASTE